MSEDKKVVRFDPNRKPDRSKKKVRPEKKQETKKSAWDGVYIFISELIEIITFPFILLYQLFQWFFGLFRPKK